MAASEPRRRLRAVPTDPEALRSFVEETRGVTEPPRPAAYHLRIDLNGVVPAVWRRLVVPSTLRLDELHPVLQSAMGWTDSHLHQWRRPDAEGAGERYATRECIDDGFGEDARCEEKVRLDDVLTTEGDVLVYDYDFGDGWEHTVVLETVERDASPDAALCTDGARACPPEDCGGVSGYARLLEALSDPAHPEHLDLLAWVGGGFDPEACDIGTVNVLLAGREAARLHPPVPDSQVAPLLARIPYQVAPQVHALLARADLQGTFPDGLPEMKTHALAHLRWLLRRVGDDGITLTSSGYLPPVHVTAAREELEWGDWWWRPSTRESDSQAFGWLRESGRAFGLTRKYRGRLLLTKRGSALLHRDQDLWEYVLATLPLGREQIERDAGRLLLLATAAGATAAERQGAMVQGLTALGWCNEDGSAIGSGDALWVAEATDKFLKACGARLLTTRRDVSESPEWAQGFARLALSM
ncbi:plasmid pRiA4b ORF-3 family protein [Rhodococcus sp. NPDC003318]|uniref:plasmid pRiA4b ORF-3 family protein n=1 Tax=Rhodococcus sp. NPDC003318 TaxID=3364503 RepID=UPI003673EF88